MTPQCLKPGDSVAIIAPASIVNPDYIDGAAQFFANHGFNPIVMPHAKGPADGSFAASLANRTNDIIEAYQNTDIKAILCARGGYGCNRLLQQIPLEVIAQNPKWLIGFSDISALHALSLRAGVVSLHAPMAKHLTLLPDDHYCTHALMRILTEGLPIEYVAPNHPLNRCGEAQGILVGGNLAVINGLAATPFDPIAFDPKDNGLILFIEDISEAIYAVERMLVRLQLSGLLGNVKALLVGQFTEYKADRNHPDMETMIARLFENVDTPPVIAYGFPAGHTDDNLPLPLGAIASLSVTSDATTLTIQ